MGFIFLSSWKTATEFALILAKAHFGLDSTRVDIFLLVHYSWILPGVGRVITTGVNGG